ncbi:MAG TPA: kelch repeat-containing protein, partial [Planctomycetaceae bacterium]|nr:kelch repeat-containing protein [Planctomycetaceae bacterium]
MYLSKRWLLLSKVFNHSSQRPGRIRPTRRRKSLNGCSRQTHFCNAVEGLESRLLLSASTTTALAPVLSPKPPSPTVVAQKSSAPSVAPTVSQTWTDMTNVVPNGDGGQLALLLSNGTLLVHGTNGNGGVSADWYEVTPDSTGGYINGTWSQAASMNVGRLYFGSVVLPNGNVFVVGGEYATDGTFNGQQELSHSAEIYNPATNTWTLKASDPQAYVGDEPTELLSNGNVLVGNIFNNSAEIYNPTTNTWSAAGTKVHNDRSDEEPWVKLPNGDILAYDLFSSISDNKFEAELYNPTTNSWSDASSNTLPILTTPSQGYELGPALVLPDGRALFTGATGLTAFFDPTTNSWTQGPTMPSVSINNVQTQLTAGDAPGAILPNGDVLLALSPAVNGGNFPGPTYIYDFNPVTGVYTNVTPSSNVDPNLGYNSYINTMLVLPTGQVLLINDNDQLAIYTPDGTPNAAWQPTITSFTNNGDGSYTLTGTQLNGLDEGAAYGDDNQMAENYPIVQVTDITSGHVYYATTSNWSSTGVATGNTLETVNVVLPASLGNDPYTLKVIANGIASNAFSPSQSPPTITAPTTASVNQNTSLAFTGGNAISVTDASGTSEQLTLAVSQGTLSLGTTTGLTVTGNGTESVTLTGALSDLNNDLASLTYTPTVGYNGPDTLSLSDKDTTDSLTGTASVSITVAPLAPSITAPATASVNENSTLAFTGGDAISVTDPSGTSEQLTLAVSQGTLNLGTTTGLTVTGNGSGTVTLTGALSDLNNDLASLTYSPTAGYNGSDTLSLSDEDTSNGLTAAASVGLTVNALAPPTLTAPSSASVNQNGSLVFSTGNGNAISVTDAAAGSNSDSLTLSVAHGTLTLASTSGLTVTAGANGSASFTVSGTVASLHTALNGLTYQPTAGYVGSDSLAVSVTDPGDSLSASTSVALTVSILPPAITAPAT